MKATGIVRRIDDLGRVVIPKEIRRTLRIREGDPSQITLTEDYRFVSAIRDIAERLHIKQQNTCTIFCTYLLTIVYNYMFLD